MDIEVCDLAGEHSRYTVRFADDAAEPWSFTLEKNGNAGNLGLAAVDKTQVGSTFLNDLSEAEVTTIGSTSVTVDAGTNLNPGWVIEVRASDYGWGVENDRNLLGRFASRTFSLPRLGTAQTYFLRQHDGSSPAKYSRFSTALHIDYPL